MSPPPRMQIVGVWRFPRVSGDEPTYLIDTNADIKFSPRERG